jgi:hypothetical protein
LGKSLIAKAVEITKSHGLNKISVISGTGVRNYYIKQGFKPVDSYVDSDGEVQVAKGNYLIRDLSESKVAESDIVESDIVESDIVESDIVESDIVESDIVKRRPVTLMDNIISAIILFLALLIYWYITKYQ